MLDMHSSYGMYAKQAYKLSFTLIGKTQTNHISDNLIQFFILVCHFFQTTISSIINVLPTINSARLNRNLTFTQNHWSYFSLPRNDIVPLCRHH